MSREIESGRGRKGELGETEDSESNCRCSEQTRLGMFTELLTPWKSQHAFTQVQAGPERTQSHFSWNKNMYRERQNMSAVFDWPQKPNPGDAAP